MVKAANVKLKVNPPLGNLPALQWMLVSQLQVDGSYQRSVEGGESQTLIRRIAQHWNWDLCQPLIVSRRVTDGATAYFVIDGQHRWCAARLRGDITQLPCVVVDYADAAAEAASFVHLNQQRRALNKLEIFRAAVAGGDPEAMAIGDAMAACGLRLAPHTNYSAWKPGMVSNIGGIEAAWRRRGPGATTSAMAVLASAFKGQVLRYAGTLFPGIAAICAEDGPDCEVGKLADMLARRSQEDWRNAMMQARANDPNLNFTRASEEVLADAWDEWLGGLLADGDDAPPAPLPLPPRPAPARAVVAVLGTPAKPAALRVAPAVQEPELVNFKPLDDGRAWCTQCERRRHRAEAVACRDRFCSFHAKKVPA